MTNANLLIVDTARKRKLSREALYREQQKEEAIRIAQEIKFKKCARARTTPSLPFCHTREHTQTRPCVCMFPCLFSLACFPCLPSALQHTSPLVYPAYRWGGGSPTRCPTCRERAPHGYKQRPEADVRHGGDATTLTCVQVGGGATTQPTEERKARGCGTFQRGARRGAAAREEAAEGARAEKETVGKEKVPRRGRE